MLYHPPTPDISLYEEGFDDTKDLLGRAETGRVLSDLVERMRQPMVIALDGGWGEGKSFFLKCWVGAHRLNKEGAAQTIYFDAFEHDFIDEPLVSLMQVIAERLETADVGLKGKTDAIVDIVKKFARPAARFAVALGTAGVSEVGNAAVDAVAGAVKAELDTAADAFWQKEEGRRTAMKEFRAALTALTAPSEAGGRPQKLVIVIDELDRCRPDYALSLLEIIKHFFAVDHVHFVLGLNMQEMENSVKARYGAGIDAELYLQKFITLTTRLPVEDGNGIRASLNYYEQVAYQMELDTKLVEDVGIYLHHLKNPKALSLRSVRRLLSNMALLSETPDSYRNLMDHYQTVLATALVCKTLEPKLYEKMLDGTPSRPFFFNLIEDGNGTTLFPEKWAHWDRFLSPNGQDPRLKYKSDPAPGTTQRQGREIAKRLIHDYLERFELPPEGGA